MVKKPKDSLVEIEKIFKLFCDHANVHIKSREYDKALTEYNQALAFNGNDINALVSRSKCYLLLGDAENALKDAETALNIDKNNIRAIYQKAESLYYLGQFELSLMFFHRGLKARPELISFRLGVQKTKEAIENTIGLVPEKLTTNIKTRRNPNKNKTLVNSFEYLKESLSSKQVKSKSSKVNKEKRVSKKLLGELGADKEYLEKLLNDPDLNKANTNTENISTYVTEAIEFLNKRLEFWRQQRACTCLKHFK